MIEFEAVVKEIAQTVEWQNY